MYPMVQSAIETLLKEKIGLDPKSIGTSKIEKVIKQRSVASGFLNLPSYLLQLQTSNQTLQELVEELVVPETWFFRDREVYRFLTHFVMTEGLLKSRRNGLRVLSMPCATGEEPYSIVMTLLDAGLTPHQFHIDAVDISQSSIVKAQRGVYGKNSFRGEELTFQNRYFQPTDAGYQLEERVKAKVNFIQGNLLDPLLLVNQPPYDIIFCRNLLIYFDSSGRTRAIQRLDQLLKMGGVLFVGSAETAQIFNQGYVSVPHPLSFAYRKVEKTPKKANPSQPFLPIKSISDESRSPVSPTISQPTSDDPSDSLLARARDLADGGQLNQAATLCQTYLTSNPTSAAAYLLLGQVHQAADNEDQAEQCFHKAIYLDPKSYEALIHLALLKEHRGDVKNATILRQRIQRLQP